MSGRVALVTGAGRGIGEAIAHRLAADGFAVAVTDVAEDAAKDVVAAIERAGGTGLAVRLDVTSSESVSSALDQVSSSLGNVEVLVNNAGWDEAMPFAETTEEFWHTVVEINYLGAVRCTKFVLDGMVDRGWGRIVSIGSDAARVGSSLEAVYAGAKGGVIAFMKTVAREVATKGVTANVVCPGPTMTPLVEKNLQESPDSERLLGKLQRVVPMRRLGQPEDIAAGVAFFVRDDASYVTGQTLSVSGGLTMA